MAFTSVHVLPHVITIAQKHGHEVTAKLLELPAKLRQSPLARGLDYESYHGAKDPRFRTARLNAWARALIWELDSQSVLIFDIAPNHEVAEQRSRTMSCRVNSLTKEFEIVTVPVTTEELADAPAAVETARLLSSRLSDNDLRQLGIPGDLARIARSLVDKDALEALGRVAPALAKPLFAVELLSDGMSKEEVYATISTLPEDTVDVNDVGSALLRSIRNGRIQVLASEAELSRAIEAPWNAWKTYLHPSQHALAYSRTYNGPMRVTGGPGTGKTIVAVHRVRALIDGLGLLATGVPVLLTTHNTSMVANLTALIESLLTPEECKLVHVTGVDRLVLDRLKKGEHRRARFEPLMLGSAIDRRIDELPLRSKTEWETPRIRYFWENVLLCMHDRTWSEYSDLRRRLKKIPAADEQIFAHIEALCQSLEVQLEEERKTTFLLRTRDALECDATAGLSYTHVVVDESQDLHPLHWRFVRQMVPKGPNDIFLVADSDQRIYRSAYPLSACGIEIRNRSKRLTSSYRCSQEILNFAYRILGSERGDDPDTTDLIPCATALFSGPAPTVVSAENEESELRLLVDKLRAWHSDHVDWGEMLVSCATNKQVETVTAFMEVSRIPACGIGPNEKATPGKVSVATIFRAKGMEAQLAVMFGVGRDSIDIRDKLVEDAERYRRALFVAATRGREQLHISWSGEPTDLLRPALEDELD